MPIVDQGLAAKSSALGFPGVERVRSLLCRRGKPFASRLTPLHTMADEQRSSHDSPNSAYLPRGSASGPSPAGAPTPNPRSCVTCRRRKVKCDKKNPCSNCVRAKIDCVFPGPGRAPRKSRKPPDAELLERLRRLEGVVTSLNAQVEGHEQEAAERQRERTGSTAAQDECQYESTLPGPTQSAPTGPTDDSLQGLENRFGRLVVENGRSRYINNSFWANLNTEVCGTSVRFFCI